MSASPPEMSVDGLLERLQPLIRGEWNQERALDWLVGLSALIRVRDEMAPKADLLARIRRDYANEPDFLRDGLFRRAAGRPYFLTDPGVVDRFLAGSRDNPKALTAEVARASAPGLRPLVDLLRTYDEPPPQNWLEGAVSRLESLQVAQLGPRDFGRLLSRLGLQRVGRGFGLPDERLVRLVGALAAADLRPGARVFDPRCLTGDLLAHIGETASDCALFGVEQDQALGRIAAGRLVLTGFNAEVWTPLHSEPEEFDGIALTLPGGPLGIRTALSASDMWRWLDEDHSRPPADAPPWFKALWASRHGGPTSTSGALVLPFGRDRARARHWLLDRRCLKTLILLPIGVFEGTRLSVELAVVGTPRSKVRVINGQRLRGDWDQELLQLVDTPSDPRVRDVSPSVLREHLSPRSLFTPPAPRFIPTHTRSALVAAADSVRSQLQVLARTTFPSGLSCQTKPVRPLGELARVWRSSPNQGERRTVAVVGLNGTRQAERAYKARDLLQPGDVLIHSDQVDRLPRVFVWRGEGPAIAATRYLAVRALDPDLAAWLGLFLQCTVARKAMTKHWAGIHGLSADSMRDLQIPLPAEKQRSALVNALTPALDAARQVHLQLDTLRRTTKEHATALLDEALAGIGED